MILRAKVKVPGPLGTKKLDNLAMLGTRALKLRRDVGPHHKMTPRAKVMVKVKVTMIFSTKKLDNLAKLGVGPSNLEGMLVLTSR